MALEWIKSYKRLERDPKALHFRALMDWSMNETIGFVHRFWWWADDVAPDGVVTSLCLPGVVGGALGVGSSVGDKAVEKMKDAGLLDVHESGEIRIHNVEKYRATSPEKREGAKERQKRSRASRSCHMPVTRDKAVTNGMSHAVTLLEEEEDKKNTNTYAHASGNSIDAFEASMSSAYQHVLDVFADVTGRKARDAATKDGARALAMAIDSGELAREHLPHVIRKGMGDPNLKNQTLRGVARNFGNYLPEEDEKTPDALNREMMECEEKVAAMAAWSPEGIVERCGDE